MNLKSMTAVSLLALMIAAPAYAADASGGEAIAVATPVTNGPAQPGDDTLHAAGGDVKAFFFGPGSDSIKPILIHNSMTAHGLIGSPVLNDAGKKVATVKDIIIDKDGKAILVVVTDNGVLGIGGKVAAFDFTQAVSQNADGTSSVKLSQNMIDHAAEFSYDPSDWAKAKVIPEGSISVNTLLEGDVLDNGGKKVASIDNVYLRNANVSQVIVGFNKTLGMGGDLAALDFNDLQMIQKKKDIDFQLSSAQTAEFKNFKKSAAD